MQVKSTKNHLPLRRTATFRFYEELNDFLPADLRKQAFGYEFTGNPSVKNSIEAVGVPHAEVDMILVDGQSVGFDYQMTGGEYISVYPVFESLDISPLIHLREKPLRNLRFIADVNLGKLARKLRLLGFDTFYHNKLEDDEIVNISLVEKRSILTRDVGILKHNAVTHAYWVRSDEPFEQLKEVVKRFQLENQMKPFTRCSKCNQKLKAVEKSRIIDQLDERTGKFFDEFFQCTDCDQVYWKGSHYDRILSLIKEVT